MPLPLFYTPSISSENDLLTLEEESSKHIVQVLRLKKGETIQLTDGNGKLVTGIIENDHKKKCVVRISDVASTEHGKRKITIAISLTKNAARFEWFLEKATEIGIDEIIPLVCERSEKLTFRSDRVKNILISAMIQSEQCWMPVLHQPAFIGDIIRHSHHQQKFIAHCIEKEKRNLTDLVNSDLNSQIILIGPEGDFSKEEVDLAVQHHFLPVSLGKTRLRTETAGIVAATLLSIC